VYLVSRGIVMAACSSVPLPQQGPCLGRGPRCRRDRQDARRVRRSPAAPGRLAAADVRPTESGELVRGFWKGKIVEGRARVQLDPDFVALLGIEDDDYHVFLTPEGDSHGLFVTNKGPGGFEVHEQHGGTSGLPFSYRVVAKRRHRQPERLATLDEPEGLFASAD
jgi:hypothetical protein